MKTFADFRAFSQAGRDLAHWHLNYETVACHPGVAQQEPASGKNLNDKTTVIHNEFITLKKIPLAPATTL